MMGRDKWQYYSMSNTGHLNSKLPININGKYSYLVSKQDIETGIFVRNWKYGDRVKLNKGSKKVSDLFIDFKLPVFKKDIYHIFECLVN